MRILNDTIDKSISEVVLILMVPEASEFRDKIKQLNTPQMVNDHSHINDTEYKKEITVSVYNAKSLENYNSRAKRLILEDK